MLFISAVYHGAAYVTQVPLGSVSCVLFVALSVKLYHPVQAKDVVPRNAGI